MKNRTKFKIVAIAMLVDAILLAIKQPVLYNIDIVARLDSGVASVILFYYIYIYKWVRLIIYSFFVYGILQLEKKYHHKIFGHFFVADWVVCLLDVTIVTALEYVPDLATDVRHYSEAAIALVTASTSFLAGTFLYSKIKSTAFRYIRMSYRLFALRYLIYSALVLSEALVHNMAGIGYLELGSIVWWTVLSWIIRMPLLILSRVILLYGVCKIKSAKEMHEEHKAKGKSHRHRHHHKQTDDEEQTMDS